MASTSKPDKTATRERPEAHSGPQEPQTPLPRRETHNTPRSRASGPAGPQDEAPTNDRPLTAEEGAALMGAPVQHGSTPPATAPEDEDASDEARAAAHFASDSTTHKLTVHREDGVFRHVEFTGLAGLSRIVLVTWPYNLLVAGSHGSYHFERYGDDTEDMFNWLRGTRVNADSWASKLINGRDSVTEYDRERLVAEVKAEVAEAVKDGAPRGLRAAVREQILESELLGSKDMAMQMVYDFEHGTIYRAKCTCGASKDHESSHDATMWGIYGGHTRAGHETKVREIGGFAFSDIGDWPIHKLNYHYLWTCHAMVWAVGQYDAVRTAVTA